MRKFMKNESGRTMLEVLGVIVIIGLLTVGGVAGYSYLIQERHRQETAKEVSQLVTSIRTGGIARRYSPAETIPAREAIKGPEMVDNGTVMRLPDGEESYAVVTTLNNGAFAVALQMQKGTCPVVLKALASQPVSMFEVKSKGTKLSANNLKKDNEAFVQGTASGKMSADRGATSSGGVRMNVDLDKMTGDKEEERAAAKARLAEMIAACEETGQARIVIDCAGGSSGYSHIYGLYCNDCAQGMLQDANGECCASYSCGNLCSCPSGTMCDTGKKTCVLCSTNGPSGQNGGNEQCWRLYHNEFARHVCDGDRNTCIECLTNMDCQSSVGPQNPYGRDDRGNYTHTYCVGHKCVECTVNYGETNGVPCATIGKPLCDNGACKPCPAGKVYDPTEKKCVCETGVEHPQTGACVFCYDNARNNGTDVGCGSGEYTGKPMCTDVAGTNSFGVGGTNNVGVTCYECVIDSNCETDEYCDKTTHTCQGCPDGLFWDGTKCRLCQDNRSGDVTDNGCATGTGPHLCEPVSGSGNGTGEYGDVCRFCRNNNFGGGDDLQDEGCSSEAKLCEASEGGYGMECHKCRDDHKGAEKDSGCATTSSICWVSETFNAGMATNQYGERCVVCVNDKTAYGTDTGCTDDKPMCNGATGEAGTECHACPEGQIWNDMLNNGCTVCYDSKTGANTDAGCGSGQWNGKPVCVTPGKVNNGQGTSGDSCAVCQNDKTEGVDLGCTDNKPLCNGAQGEYGTACTECPDGQIWNGRVCAVCFDTETGVNRDAGCGSGTWAGKPICVTPGKVNNGQGTPGNSCAVCVNDKTEGVDLGCTDDKPMCNGAQGEYGTACTECPDGQIWNGRKCAVCFDTATGVTTDNGCGSGTWAGKPICGARGWVNNGQGTDGDHCVVCHNDKEGNAVDTGCGAKPLCDAPQGQFGNSCVCPAGQVWNGQECATCFDTATGGNTDSGCGSGTWAGKPLCGNEALRNDGQGTKGTHCAVCKNDQTGATRDSGCPDNTPLCNGPQDWFSNTCVVCFDTAAGDGTDTGCGSGSWAGKPICGAQGYANDGQGAVGDHCAVCKNDQTGDARDSGCPSDKPTCNAPQGQFGNTCEKPCSGNDKCIDNNGTCINVNSYDDIERGSDGRCSCLKGVRTQDIRDMGNSYNGKRNIEDGSCKRLITNRKRIYEVKVNFYCPRYMHVDKNAEADDYVASSYPAGISSGGTNGTRDSWKESHNNAIANRVSNSTIQKGTANIVVSDRWAAEVGLNGFIYFTKTKDAVSGSVQKLTATKKWKDSKQSDDTGKYRCKEGESGCGNCSGSSSGGSSGGGSSCSHKKCGSHISHAWIKARAPNCRDCGTNKHEKADSDNKNTPHTHYYCYCDTCSCP